MFRTDHFSGYTWIVDGYFRDNQVAYLKLSESLTFTKEYLGSLRVLLQGEGGKTKKLKDSGRSAKLRSYNGY